MVLFFRSIFLFFIFLFFKNECTEIVYKNNDIGWFSSCSKFLINNCTYFNKNYLNKKLKEKADLRCYSEEPNKKEKIILNIFNFFIYLKSIIVELSDNYILKSDREEFFRNAEKIDFDLIDIFNMREDFDEDIIYIIVGGVSKITPRNLFSEIFSLNFIATKNYSELKKVGKNIYLLEWSTDYIQSHRDSAIEFFSNLEVFNKKNSKNKKFKLFAMSYGGEIFIQGLLNGLKKNFSKNINLELITWGTPITKKSAFAVEEIGKILKSSGKFNYIRLIASKEDIANFDKLNRDGIVDDQMPIKNAKNMMVYIKIDNELYKIDHTGNIIDKNGYSMGALDIYKICLMVQKNNRYINYCFKNKNNLRLIFNCN